ncbi:RagB/SusD family nutrient uptake outer membrane protein [Draconibacterium sediminis]|uniref:Carbohydrate-binding protein SusD n=1 Tax=Draconibacterium sediminis TaxID=1544798 RepID=A0A0D8JEM9_9BACT|nr:RagB/SusD family nutrient uptake outer membrane protein [Draconibacterium sediminis]KJF45347.1 hypothetical protein LH29_08215 [Draconibacterium sediminis]
MKNIKYLAILSLFLGLFSCDDILDTKLDDRYGDEWTWGLPYKAEGVLLNAYANIPGQFDNYGNNFLDVITDNAVTNDFGSSMYQMALGGISATNQPVGNWSTAYDQFRNINLFLENGLEDTISYKLSDPAIDKAIKERLYGEAHFLRAWWGMELLKVYGGVASDGEALGYVISTSTITDEDKESVANLRRNTYEECIAQILMDCDTAIAYLPMAYDASMDGFDSDEIGRATQKTAYALKSRAALFAASPAYQPESSYSGSSDDLIQKWERAAVLAFQAVTDGQLGNYSALKENMMYGGNLNVTPDDYLLRKFHNNNSMENRNLPPFFLGNGYTNPSQNLVDAFPASNGFPITDPRSDYDPQNPYVDRDPRLALTVIYNGASVEQGGRGAEIYFDQDSGKPGLDAPGYDYKNTRTGYYLRKWISNQPGMLIVGEKKNDFHMHAVLRRAEVYYNWAEAANEAVGPTAVVPGTDRSALDIMRDIRKKSIGVNNDIYLDEIAAQGKDAFRELILNERRIEFAFENQRYFDLRRTLQPLNEGVKGVTVNKTGDMFTYVGTNPNAESLIVEDRPFSDMKYYYTPIPYSELLKSPNMKNNKGW